jgi:SAM-dependent methyltransferase
MSPSIAATLALMNAPPLPEHVAHNREYWDSMAGEWIAAGEVNWDMNDPVWGIWGIPDTDVSLLPSDMRGMRAIELGCGTAYVSAWMARRGAVVTGIDNSEAQLRTAARLAGEHGIAIELIHGNAEMVPAEDGSFDYAVSEYGAAIWCDPYKWIPEAHRLLRRGGELAFLGTHPLAMACTPPSGEPSEDRLHRPWFGMHSFDFRGVEVDPGGMEFNLGTGEWMRLFSDTGFRVLSYRELRAPESATGDRFGVPVAWARSWPAERVWHLRKG